MDALKAIFGVAAGVCAIVIGAICWAAATLFQLWLAIVILAFAYHIIF